MHQNDHETTKWAKYHINYKSLGSSADYKENIKTKW